MAMRFLIGDSGAETGADEPVVIDSMIKPERKRINLLTEAGRDITGEDILPSQKAIPYALSAFPSR